MKIVNNVRCLACSYAFSTGFKVFSDTEYSKIDRKIGVYGIKVGLEAE